MEEHHFQCPYCSAPISMVLDLSSGGESYIEDCEVCCQPIQIGFEVGNSEINDFYAKNLEE